MDASEAKIRPYNLETQSFWLNSGFFSQQYEYTKDDTRSFSRGQGALPPLKSYLYFKHVYYKLSFEGTENIQTMKVPAESDARAVEAMREDGKVVLYGYVESVEREHFNDNPGEEHYINFRPQFVDFIKDGQVVYTHKVI